jgi:hypothetical protein
MVIQAHLGGDISLTFCSTLLVVQVPHSVVPLALVEMALRRQARELRLDR